MQASAMGLGVVALADAAAACGGAPLAPPPPPPPRRAPPRRRAVSASASSPVEVDGAPRPRGARAPRGAPPTPVAPAPGALQPLPRPCARQQTLRASFTLGGVGLHTGRYATVRVRPAYAGEGRYFVRVPEGTNMSRFVLREPAPLADPEAAAAAAGGAPRGAGADAAPFFAFLAAREDAGFEGTYQDYLEAELGLGADDAAAEAAGEDEGEGGALVAGSASDAAVPASLAALEGAHPWYTSLVSADGQARVVGAEVLLGALEACGVDNARIELEGGDEVPVVDGSALCWALDVQRAGLADAPAPPGGAPRGGLARRAPAPARVVTVWGDGDGGEEGAGEPSTSSAPPSSSGAGQRPFISFYPGGAPRVTYGLDATAESAAVGSQWFSWSPACPSATPAGGGGGHYRWALAPARAVIPSVAAADALIEEGLLRAGPENCALVGDGASFLDEALVRFWGDEAARSGAAALLGVLALGAAPGGRGLPQGHVVAFGADRALAARFAAALAEAAAGREVEVDL